MTGVVDRKTKLLYWFIFLQCNPVSFYLIATSGGHGITTYRLLFSVILSALFIFLSVLLKFHLRRKDYIYIFTACIIIVGSMFLDQRAERSFDINLYVIFIEYVFAFWVVAAFYSSKFNAGVTYFRSTILFFICINIAIWGYSVWQGTSWGIFRSYISGFTINRLPDFILTLFLPWIFVTSGIFVSFLSVVYITLTSYRTLFLAFIISLAFLFIFGSRRIRYNTLRNSFLFLLCATFLVIWMPDAAKVIERVISLFQFESKVAGETSKSQRIADLWHLINSLPKCLFIGCGSADPISKISYYNYPFFPIWVFNVFGISGLIFNIWLFMPVLLFSGQRGSLISAIFFSLFITLMFFPYVHYFPLVIFVAILNFIFIRGQLSKAT